MKIYEYFVRRIFLLIPVLIGVSIMTFSISRVVPGDPVRAMVGMDASKEVIENIKRKYGFDKPLPEQYFIYMRGLLHGDMGLSIRSRRPVLDDVKTYLPATFELAFVALLLSSLIGIPLGVISAVQQDKALDHATRILALIGVSAPSFWLGLLVQLVLYRKLGWLPYGARIDSAIGPPRTITTLYLLDSLLTANIPAFISSLKHIAMPAFVLAYGGLASVARLQRASMLEVIRKDYIRVARAKGLSERRVIYIHALKNALIPVITIIGLRFGWMLGGSFIVEFIFNWPGLGYYGTTAITTLDFNAIMGITLILTVSYLVANLIVDIVYVFVDPRIEYG